MNYNKVMEETIKEIYANSENRPRLLLHSCCGPCSTSVIERLSPFFEITVFFYNPNISDVEEYKKRRDTQIQFIEKFNDLKQNQNKGFKITFLEGAHDADVFLKDARQWADCPEGGQRCSICFMIRLRETGKLAKKERFAYFATTLSVSPMKDVNKLSEIGLQVEHAISGSSRYLLADFKKKAGYQRSIELSKENGLYRQHFCGCIFSGSSDSKENAENEKQDIKK